MYQTDPLARLGQQVGMHTYGLAMLAGSLLTMLLVSGTSSLQTASPHGLDRGNGPERLLLGCVQLSLNNH